jgi:glycosyltransferase involved in cell wall biosynthesis
MVDVLRALNGRVNRVLAGPGFGGFIELVRRESLAEELIELPRRPGSPFDRVLRVVGGLKLAWWAMRNRARLGAIHANALTGLNLSVPAAMIARRPTVVWIHDPVGSRWGSFLGPMVRRLTPGLRIAAVSHTAERVAVENGLCREGDALIVPNPIDPADVLASREAGDASPVAIGVLGGASSRKGFDLLPETIDQLAVEPALWRLYISSVVEPGMEETWSALRSESERVEVNDKVADVRLAYRRLDIVFCPSRNESFCRVAAEAMMNGLPVVASDIEPLRALLGDDEAGILFPVDDVASASAALRRLVADPNLRLRLGEEGRKRAHAFEPGAIAGQLLGLYGVA